MPELPEVECVKQNISPYIINQQVKLYSINKQTKLFDGLENLIENKIENQKIIEIERIGKHLLFHLSNFYTLYIHLGMSGSLFFSEDSEIKKHEHFILTVPQGYIKYRDPRRFGKILIFQTIQRPFFKRLQNIGEDALKIDFDSFYRNIIKKNNLIKSALLNQSILAGVGNIYADEALFLTKLNPQQKTKSISKNKYFLLFQNIQNILNQAIKAKGSSVTYAVGGQEHKGNFQTYLNVYRRTNQKCNICNNKIIKIEINNRGTHFCENCQPKEN